MIASDIKYAKSVVGGVATGLGENNEESKGCFRRRINGLHLAGDELSHFQNILLITDGTVTELLEYISGEPIVIEKLHQSIESSYDMIPHAHRPLIAEEDFPALIRKILLKGQNTASTYIYAESSVLLRNLPDRFKEELINSHIPIGKLWAKHQVETYKTNFNVKREKADPHISHLLSVPAGSDILSRTYCVYTCGSMAMMITEKFSVSCFS